MAHLINNTKDPSKNNGWPSTKSDTAPPQIPAVTNNRRFKTTALASQVAAGKTTGFQPPPVRLPLQRSRSGGHGSPADYADDGGGPNAFLLCLPNAFLRHYVFTNQICQRHSWYAAFICECETANEGRKTLSFTVIFPGYTTKGSTC